MNPRQRPRPLRHDSADGFTLVELLVVIGIIALLISILLPTLNRVRSSSRAVVCASNLRQHGQALIGYASAYNSSLPYSFWRAPVGSDRTAAVPPDADVMTYHTAVASQIDAAGGPIYSPGEIASDGLRSGIFACPEVEAAYQDYNGNYGLNSVALPDLRWEQQLATLLVPADTVDGGAPPARAIKPAKLNQLYGGETALVWDAPADARGAKLRRFGSNGSRDIYDPEAMMFMSGVDYGNLLFPQYPYLRYYSPDAAEKPALAANPYFAQGQPAMIWHEPAKSPPIVPVSDFPPGSSIFYAQLGAPVFRHGGQTTANVAFADGSVRPIKWYPKQRHPADPAKFAVSDLQRTNLRIKHPSGPVYGE